MQRQWGNAVLTSLKRSEKEGAMCTECIRPQCNSRKVCLADRESLNQSTSFKNSCACRNGSASVSHCAKSLAQCNTWEGWPGQDCGGGSGRAIAQSIGYVPWSQGAEQGVFMANTSIHVTFSSIRAVISLHISKVLDLPDNS